MMTKKNQLWFSSVAVLVLRVTASCVGSDIQNVNGRVIYPLEAIALKLEGTSELRVTIDAHGFIEDVQVENSSGHQILDDAAMGSIYQWVFKKPAGNKEMKFIVPVQFKLTKDSFRELPEISPTTRRDAAQPKLLRQPKPYYPYQAYVTHITGTAHVRMVVSERGFVSKAWIAESSGHKILDYSALITTYRFVWDPKIVDGKPVSFDVMQPVIFER